MLRISSLAAACLLSAPVFAQVWQKMPVSELSGVKLYYDGAWQEFRPSGRTLYNAGQDSWGYWRDQDGQYCSQWPPNGAWDCYDLERSGDEIRFIDPQGNITTGRIK